MSGLRMNAIRLAHMHPEMRPYLLPILAETHDGDQLGERLANMTYPAARMATRHRSAAGVRDTSLLPGAVLKGEGTDAGYFIYVERAASTGAGNFWVDGYIRRRNDDDNRTYFTTFIGPTAKNPPPKFTPGIRVEPELTGRIRRILKDQGARLLNTLSKLFPQDVAAMTSSYKGSSAVFVISGKYRESPLPQDVGTIRKDRHHLTATQPVGSGAMAEKMLDDAVNQYERNSWPGGSATKLGIIYWRDLNQWSGVYETYYSFS